MRRCLGTMMIPAGLFAAIVGCPGPTSQDHQPDETRLLIFHNGNGPMCLDALNWLAEAQQEHPDLIIEEHLTTDPAGLALFGQLVSEYGQSQGVSTTFGYLPVILVAGHAFSGFNEEVRAALEALIE